MATMMEGQTALDFDSAPISVYTDGACAGNPGPGGWGWVLAPDATRTGSGAERHTTNQRMELMAALDALRTFASPTRPLEIVSDSKYLVDCFDKRWYVGWRRRDWTTAAGDPVKNQDLWRPIIDLALANPVEFRWVRGHAGDPLNEAADRVAVAARDAAR